MRIFLATCLLCISPHLAAQAQFSASMTPVALEVGQSTTFSLVFRNPNSVAVPAQELRARFFSLSAPFDRDFDVTPIAGPCSDWEDGLESQGVINTRFVRFSVPEVATSASIECRYRIARRTTGQRNMDLAFINLGQPSFVVARVPIGVLTDIGGSAQLLYSVAEGTSFVHRFRITISNYGAFDTSAYGFGVCDYPNVPRVRMNFPGGCNPDAPGQACFAVGFPQEFKGGLVRAGGQTSCELETYGVSPNPVLPGFTLSTSLARDIDGATMLDINPANDGLRSVAANTLVAVSGLSTFAALGCALLLFAIALAEIKRR